MLLFLLPWPPHSLATTEAKGRVGEPDMAQKIVSELHFRSSSVFGPSLALLLRIAACVLCTPPPARHSLLLLGSSAAANAVVGSAVKEKASNLHIHSPGYGSRLGIGRAFTLFL